MTDPLFAFTSLRFLIVLEYIIPLLKSQRTSQKMLALLMRRRERMLDLWYAPAKISWSLSRRASCDSAPKQEHVRSNNKPSMHGVRLKCNGCPGPLALP
eukprot:3418623-Pleurochrysis_carterae.AAC.5